MGVLSDAPLRVWNSYPGQQVHRLTASYFLGHALVQLQGFAKLLFDGKHWIEGGHGLLENHGHLGAPYCAHLVPVYLEDILAVEVDLTI